MRSATNVPLDGSGHTSFCSSPSRLRTPYHSADCHQESAAFVTTAAAGNLLQRHEQATVVVTRPRLFGFSAEERAQYKERSQVGTRGICAGPSAERDARLQHVEGTDVVMNDRTRTGRVPAARRSEVGHDEQRVDWNRKGTRRCTVRRRLACARGRGLGSLVARRTCLHRLPTCRPAPGLRSHLPGSTGPLMSRFRIIAREATQRIVHSPTRRDRMCAGAIHLRSLC